MAIFLHSREGVIQAELLSIIAYGIGFLSRIKNIKKELPDVTHPWYADDSRELGMFARIVAYFYLLELQGPGCGYYPES